jgi:predicted KAP-like P-loop ATPase
VEDLRLDAPVSAKTEDHFQRYEFSRRIAKLINAAKFRKSLVIGIYGKWGEGKSSVLNFIASEINSESIQIKFNPWYFQEDKQLVKAFFETVASALGKKLAAKKDEILQVIEDYSDAVGSVATKFVPYGIGSVFGAAKKLAAKFKKDSLEHYKSRVEGFIQEANCNFVVFIDDIDRLNIEEIQSIFRLVKLVGDFPRFTYVLAFDDELVAASLGHQYGEKGKADGYSFLEKIIQVPLTLPKAEPFALRKYSLDLVNTTLSQLGVELTTE